MKQELNIGNTIDDGTGDWLQLGGQKIKSNFDEIYGLLGDGMNIHAAGSAKVINKPEVIDLNFGDSIAANTSSGVITINLPKGKSTDYSKLIKIYDAWGSWVRNPVKIVPALGDTIKGSTKPLILKRGLMVVNLTYTSPGRWEYPDNIRVDKISTSDLNSVAKKEFIVQEDGQVDFLNIFDGDKYNTRNTTVHWRGNLLSYGESFSSDSDFGSPGQNPGELVELDGLNIRLKNPTSKGDSVIITSYLDGIASWRATYTRANLRMIDPNISPETPQRGKSALISKSKNEVSLDSFEIEGINPNSLEVTLNGALLNQVGSLGVVSTDFPYSGPINDKGYTLNNQYSGYCVGLDVDDAMACFEGGGQWYNGVGDFDFEYDKDGIPLKILFNTILEHNDVVSIRWFNNNIGTTMELDEILIETDNRYINKGDRVELTNQIEYTKHENNPTSSDTREAPDTTIESINTISQMFELFYPVGTVYTNAHNKANPRDYMGFGTWVRYAEGRTIVGWDSDPLNSVFNKNQQELDQNNNMKSIAGGTLGTQNTTLKFNNIPPFKIEGSVLVADKNGSIVIGGCLDDPDSEGPGYKKYSEESLSVGVQSPGYTPETISLIQPSITVYTWLRVA